MNNLCRFCKARSARREGLCLACFRIKRRTGDADTLEEDVSDFGELMLIYSPEPLPEESTDCLPGSPGKIAVLRQRARKRVQLFHPADPRVEPATA